MLLQAAGTTATWAALQTGGGFYHAAYIGNKIDPWPLASRDIEQLSTSPRASDTMLHKNNVLHIIATRLV